MLTETKQVSVCKLLQCITRCLARVLIPFCAVAAEQPIIDRERHMYKISAYFFAKIVCTAIDSERHQCSHLACVPGDRCFTGPRTDADLLPGYVPDDRYDTGQHRRASIGRSHSRAGLVGLLRRLHDDRLCRTDCAGRHGTLSSLFYVRFANQNLGYMSRLQRPLPRPYSRTRLLF